jgi:hypothetical protein
MSAAGPKRRSALAVHLVGGLNGQQARTIFSRTEPCSAGGLPKAARDADRWHIFRARWVQPIDRIAMMDAAGAALSGLNIG